MRKRDVVKGVFRRILGGSPPASPPAPAPAVAPAPLPPRRAGAATVSVGDLWAVRAALAPEGRYKLVNHWATWCEGCVEELPDLVRAHREFSTAAGGTADFVSIAWEAFSVHDSVAAAAIAVEAAAKETGLDWTHVVYDGDPDTLFSGLELPDDKIPQTAIFDPSGRLVFSRVGPVRYEEIAQVLRAAAPAAPSGRG